MSSSQRLIDIPFDCETSVAYTVHQLKNAGLHVSRSFELDSACGSLTTGICSHDQESPCKCQLVVLRVTVSGSEPVSLILHSYNGKTEVYLDEIGPSTRQEIKARINQALVF